MKALIIGAGKSGKSASKLLKKQGYRTYLVDDNKKFIFKTTRDRLFESLSLCVVSPGVALEHELIQETIKRGAEVIGELELGARSLKGEVVAITGTNGKTTTTSLTYELLKGEESVFVGGNIGIPVTSFALASKQESKSVLEVSSFQLETIKSFKPKVAVLLNLAPDHLNRHKTMENYIKAKLRIFENQDSNDFAVINADDNGIKKVDLSHIKSQIFYFSTKHECVGCYAKSGKIYFYNGENKRVIMKTKDITLKGEHNLSNVLASLLSAILMGANIGALCKAVHNFKGAKHRLEYIAEVDGVTFIDDSKATNIASTIVACKAMSEPTTLILGGSDKGYEFDQLFAYVPVKIRNIVVVGETKAKIISAAERAGISNVYEAKTFKEAVYLAKDLAKEGEIVLLSPACASFDMFSSYEERGRVFAKLVRELEKRANSKGSCKKAKKVEV